MKTRKIKRHIRRNFGKTGVRFVRDVKCETTRNGNILFGAIKGVTDAISEIKKARTEKQMYDNFLECRHELRVVVKTLGTFIPSSLIMGELYTENDDRYKEIFKNTTCEMLKILKDLNDGYFDFVLNLEDNEPVNPCELFISMVTNRLLVATKLTPAEYEVFAKLREENSL